MRGIRVEATPRRAAAVIETIGLRTITGDAPGLSLRLPRELATSAVTLGRQLPNIVVALLTPAALVALAMGLWRVGVDLDWAAMFPIGGGLFSHWQVWIALSIALKMLSSSLLAWDTRTRE
jgi:hypothetical protein